MQNQARIRLMWILVEMINTTCVKTTGAALNAMNLVPLLKKQFSQVTAVLACNTSDKCLFQAEYIQSTNIVALVQR